MKILVLNQGSSSIKCFLFDLSNLPKHFTPPIWQSHVDWKNAFESPSLKIKNIHGHEHIEKLQVLKTDLLLEQILAALYQGPTAILTTLDEIDVIGHRIVHGANAYKESVFIDDKVKEKIRSFSELAPLHNCADLEGITILEKIFKDKSQIAVFDTAFHHTLQPAAAVYPVPYQWYEEGIQRYGFHGISFQYCSKQVAAILPQSASPLKMVICHLGSGASLCAIENGRSIDTTMGFTPLEGLMMDTRSGSIDPGILLYQLKKNRKSIEELSDELYKKSGLLGISGTSSDMRDIIEKSSQGDPRAALAFDVYIHRLCSLIGSMVVSLRGMEALIFTGGIGENASLLRKRVCDNLSFLGLKLDQEINNKQDENDCVLSSPDSKIKILLIHTQEAFEIARECWNLRSNNCKSGM